jgi:Cd2+/Zn2+-exporting ATPase
LIKGGAYLEALGKVQVMAFDKTGTLTHGRPELAYASCDNERCWNAVQLGNQLDQCPNCDDLLALAAAVERHSGHPIARAVVRAAERRGLPKLTASSVEDIPGRGVQGWVEGSHVIVGSHDVFHENAPQELKCCKQLGAIRVTPQTTLVVSENGTLRGYVFVSDLLRSNSQEALKDLKRVGISRTIMLTGDNDIVAQLVSKSLAMDEVHSNLLPQDKVEAVRTLMSENDHVAMVGDGVNDAPALAIATVGIAMGGAGTAQALESADVALMADDLTQLPSTIRLARRAIEIIRFNIWFALIIKALFLVGALLGTVTLWMAVFADMGASLLVTFNGMRLLKHEDCSYSSPTST